MKTKTQKPKHMSNLLLVCEVAGIRFGDIQSLEGLKAGLPLDLFHEKQNKFDGQAIRVEYKGTKLGYIPRAHTDLLHKAKKAGAKFYTKVKGYFPANPSWQQLYVEVWTDQKETENKEESKF